MAKVKTADIKICYYLLIIGLVTDAVTAAVAFVLHQEEPLCCHYSCL
jgi:hypothetical protein